MKSPRENPFGKTARPEDEVPLPHGYHLDRANPEVLTPLSPEGAVVARFSARGYVAESVEREVWEDHKQRNS
jgi:hypothetical protein